MPPFELDPAKAQTLLDSVPVKYLTFDRGGGFDMNRYIDPVIQHYPEKWQLAYTSPDRRFEIYRRTDR
jgi:hypothetical protein